MKCVFSVIARQPCNVAISLLEQKCSVFGQFSVSLSLRGAERRGNLPVRTEALRFRSVFRFAVIARQPCDVAISLLEQKCSVFGRFSKYRWGLPRA